MTRTIASLSILLLLVISPVAAVTIDTVPVGNPGNPSDPTDGDLYTSGVQHYGSVGYNYRIGTYEVTVRQYAAFLNAVAKTDTYGLYSPSMGSDFNIGRIARFGAAGSYSYSVLGLGANKPITYVGFGDAARFANWIQNGQPVGLQDSTTTERGAYTLDGANTNADLLAVSRNAGSQWFIPTENEWYKAAYHKNDGTTNHYWLYPTATNVTPTSDQPPGSGSPIPSNTANFSYDDGLANGYNDGFAVTGVSPYNENQGYLTDVGAYSLTKSAYGTFDQAGNVQELLEPTTPGDSPAVRGGYWAFNLGFIDFLQPSYRGKVNPLNESASIGFRLATVPEPSTLALAGIGALGLVVCKLRRRRASH